MADSKISQLTPITGANLLDSDEFIVARADTFENFAVTRAEMFLDTPAITTSDLTATTADINGGTIDGTVIGGTAAAAGTFTNLTATTALTGTLATAAQPNVTSVGTLTSATITGDLTVDTDTLYVDSANNRVGIGTSSPASIAHINGDDAVLIIQDSDATNYTTNQSQIHFKTSTNVVGLLGYESDSDEHLSIKANGGSSAIKMFAGNFERMRIDSSGNVGIGTSSPDGNLTVGNTSTSGDVSIRMKGDATSRGFLMFGDTGGAQLGDIMYDHSDNHMRFRVNNSEAMRIDSSGNLLVGQSSTTTPGVGNTITGAVVRYVGDAFFSRDEGPAAFLNRNTSNGTILNFQKDSTTVGTISVTGSTTSYNTSSDERLKENIADAQPASDLIDGIQVREFDWKADGEHQRYGMVAQELETVAPEAVTKGETEDDMWSVDYSKLAPMLVKEIQDLRKRVADLET